MPQMSETKTDLNQLVIFAKVVDTRSFTAAGRALGLPKSTVSRKVAQLEQRLGVRLLRRTTRKLSLTEVGAAFYERCARISTEIDEAELAVAHMHDVPRGLLRVAASHELGEALLSELLGDFLMETREVDVELSLTSREVDLVEEGYDLSLHFGDAASQASDVLSAELGVIRTHLVASPEYIERRGTPSSPEALEHHELVALGPIARGAGLQLSGPQGASASISKRPRLVVNSLATQREAVLGGVGIGLLPAFICDQHLHSGRLELVLRGWGAPNTGVYVRYPTSRHLSAKVRALSDFIGERLAPTHWPTRATTTNTTTTTAGLHEASRAMA